MKTLLFASLTLSLLAALFAAPASAARLSQGNDPCPTGTPVLVNSECVPFGSYAVLQRMLESGKFFFQDPLPTTSPDPTLAQLPFYYARVNTANAPIFATPNDAAAGKPVQSYLEGGLVYVTYTDVQEIGGKNYYMIEYGQWMRRGDISPNQLYSPFAGLQFSSTPYRPFGWVLDAQVIGQIQPRKASSQSAALADVFIDQYQVIQVYETREAEGLRWYQIAPEQWLESRQVRLVLQNTTPQDGVTNNRWIEVNLEQQTLSVYQDGQLVFATLIATGLPGVWTRPGLFQIYERHESTLMRGAFEADRSDFYFLEDVPWTMYFDEARALHGAYWRARFGFEQSHGCVNLSVADSHWLFNWAVDGDWVWVHDDSGRTPSDFVGAGGA
jgi:lipoprotein-anchoring transpeptidase ErfK/SrfK